jgi:hypothetical protein
MERVAINVTLKNLKNLKNEGTIENFFRDRCENTARYLGAVKASLTFEESDVMYKEIIMKDNKLGSSDVIRFSKEAKANILLEMPTMNPLVKDECKHIYEMAAEISGDRYVTAYSNGTQLAVFR